MKVPFSARFLALSRRWLSDPEMKRLTMARESSPEHQRAWFDSLSTRRDYLIWGVEVAGEPVGAFGLKNIERRRGEYFGYIGEKRYWGMGVGDWMVRRAMDVARELGLSELYLRVVEGNSRAVGLYTKHGFVRRRRDASVTFMERGL